MKPGVRIRHGIDGPLVLPRLLRSQLLPRVDGLSDVLDGVFAETNTLPGSVAEATDAAVEDLQALGLDCLLLTGNLGCSSAQSNGTDKRGDDENLSAHGFPQVKSTGPNAAAERNVPPLC